MVDTFVKAHHNNSMNIYSEQTFGLYEDPTIASLDPLHDILRSNPFVDSFWDTEDYDDSPELALPYLN